jgi:hypothetical protein
MNRICQLGSCLNHATNIAVEMPDDSVYPGFVDVLDICNDCMGLFLDNVSFIPAPNYPAVSVSRHEVAI